MSTQINISTGGGGVTSVDLTMPSAFSVAGNPIISAGTLAVTGAGSASEYIRGDGTLANFPNSTGGGASVNYYLNGGTTVATISGVTYYELNKLAAVGTPTNFNVASNDYIASFLTNPADPNKLLIPAGNWNFALYFSASTNAGSPNFYVELYKYDGTTFTLIADTSASPKDITSGTTKDLYTTIMAVPQTTLILTDRLAVRVYVNNSGNTITLHTQGDNLCQIVTTFTTGLTALNGLTDQVQFFGASTASPIGITSAGNTHTLNIPDASQTVRGVVSTGLQTFAGSKTFSSTPTFSTMTPGSILFAGPAGILTQDNPNLFWDDTNNRLGIATSSPAYRLDVTGDINTSGVIRTPFIRFQNTSIGIDITAGTVTIPGGNFGIGAAPTGNTKLDVRALNAVATDIGIRLRDSTNAKDLFSVSNTGVLRVTHPTFTGELQVSFINNNVLRFNHTGVGDFMTVGATNVVNFGGQTVQAILRGGQFASSISGSGWGVNISGIPAASSGTTDVDALRINPTINNTGTYSGIVRGIYYNPTLASLTGTIHRAIETRTGDAIFNSTSGNVAIGGTSFGASANKVLAVYTGTAPTTSPAGAFQMYSAVAGPALAVPHFRTETGDVIRLYKQSSVGIATVPQLIIVLQNLGLLT
jgi:hypothetical protein